MVVPLVLAVVAAFASIDTVRTARTTDFFCFWSAANLVVTGGDPFDPRIWEIATSGSAFDRYGRERTAPCPGRSGYPLTTSIALAPLGALPLVAAAAIWQMLLIVGTLIGVLLWWRHLDAPWSGIPLFATLVFASQPFAFTLITAQFGGLLLGVAGLVAGLEMSRPRAAGAALALLGLKPHVVAFTLIAMPIRWLARGPRSAVVTAGTLGAGLLLISLVLRPTWPIAWLGELGGQRLGMTLGVPTIWSLASVLTGDARFGVVPVALSSALYWLALRGRRLGTVDLVAVSLVATLLVSPYAGGHDQLLLAPAWGTILAAGLGAAGWIRGAFLVTVVACASALPWILYADAVLNRPDDTFGALVVIATAIAHAASITVRSMRT